MKKIIYTKFIVDVLKIFFLTSFTLVSIIWILQAVNFLDIVSEDGHSFKTYFSYSILNIPKIFSKTFPEKCLFLGIRDFPCLKLILLSREIPDFLETGDFQKT